MQETSESMKKMSEDEVKKRLEEIVNWYLEDYSFEELLEEFDLTPSEVFIHLFNSGLIDETRLESFLVDA